MVWCVYVCPSNRVYTLGDEMGQGSDMIILGGYKTLEKANQVADQIEAKINRWWDDLDNGPNADHELEAYENNRFPDDGYGNLDVMVVHMVRRVRHVYDHHKLFNRNRRRR